MNSSINKPVPDNKEQEKTVESLNSVVEQMVTFIKDSSSILTDQEIKDSFSMFTDQEKIDREDYNIFNERDDNSQENEQDNEDNEKETLKKQIEDELLKRLIKIEKQDQKDEVTLLAIKNLYTGLAYFALLTVKKCPIIRKDFNWNHKFGVVLTTGHFVDSIAAYHYIHREGADKVNPHIPGIGRLLKRDVSKINEEYEQRLSAYKFAKFGEMIPKIATSFIVFNLLLSLLWPPLLLALVAIAVISVVVAYYVANKNTNEVIAEGRLAAEAFIKENPIQVVTEEEGTVTPRKPTYSASPTQSHVNGVNGVSKSSANDSKPVIDAELPSSSSHGLFAIAGTKPSGQPDSAISPKTPTPKANGK